MKSDSFPVMANSEEEARSTAEKQLQRCDPELMDALGNDSGWEITDVCL
jgi:hypothetical protein